MTRLRNPFAPTVVILAVAGAGAQEFEIPWYTIDDVDLGDLVTFQARFTGTR